MKAFYIKALPYNNGADQKLYRLEPPIGYTTYGHNDEESKTSEYVIVSGANIMFSGPETYIFPADSDGNVTSWGELSGSFRGAINHQKSIENAGYMLVEYDG